MTTFLMAAAMAAAFFVALALLPASSWLAVRIGAVDHPDRRKLHQGPTPCLGGVAVLGGIAAGMIMMVASDPPIGNGVTELLLAMGAGAAALLVIGVLDDRGPMPAHSKFLVEAVIAAVIVVGVLDLNAVRIGQLTIGGPFGVFAMVLAAFWVVAVVNAYNMIDGVDGLAGGVGAIAALGFAVVGMVQGNAVVTTVALILAAALAAFLVFNLPPARVFMGDAGSLPVGFLLALLGITALTGPDGSWDAVPALLILGLPATDITLAVTRRFLRSLTVVREHSVRERFEINVQGPARLFTPDRGHLHHRVAARGFSPRGTLGICLSLATFFMACGVVLAILPVALPAVALAVLAVVGLFIIRRLYGELHVLKRGLLLPLFDTRLVSHRATHVAYDALAATAALLASGWMLRGVGAAVPSVGPFTIIVLASTFTTILALAGVYRVHFRHMGIWQAVQTTACTLTAGWASIVAVSWQVGTAPSAAFTVLYLYLVTTGVLAARASFRIFDGVHQRRRRGGHPALIFGVGRGGLLVLRELLGNPALGLEPVAFMDDDPHLWGRDVEGYPVLNPTNGFLDVVRSAGIRVIIVSSNKVSPARVSEILKIARANDWEDLRVLRFRWREEHQGGTDGDEPWESARRPRNRPDLVVSDGS